MEYILFDVGNVLVRADQSLTHNFLEELGVSRENAEKFYKNNKYASFNSGKTNEREFYNSLCGEMKCEWLSQEQVERAHNLHIYAVEREVLEIIESFPLERRGFLTDSNLWQERRVRELVNLEKYVPIERIFRSHRIGAMKTEDYCFEHVINSLRVNPEEIILVDDSAHKIKKAEENGLQTIRYTTPCELKNSLSKK